MLRRTFLSHILQASTSEDMWDLFTRIPQLPPEYVYVGLDLLHEQGEMPRFVEYAIGQTKGKDSRENIGVLLLSLAWLATCPDEGFASQWESVRGDIHVYMHAPGNNNLQQIRYGSTCKAQALTIVSSADIPLHIVWGGTLADLEATDEYPAVAAQ